MKSTRKYILAVCVLAIGFAVPSIQAQEDAPRPPKKEGGPRGDRAAMLKEKLGLTDAQTEQIKKIFADQQGNAVWRANVLCYNDPELHQPRLEHERRPFDPAAPVWVRVERQSLKRLTETATVFAIHTYLVPLEELTPEQLATLPDNVRRGGSMGETN